MKRFLIVILTGMLGFIFTASVAFALDPNKKQSEAYYARKRVFVSKVHPWNIVTSAESKGNANYTAVTNPIYVGSLEGEFSATLRINQTPIGTGGVNVWYRVSDVSETFDVATYPGVVWKAAQSREEFMRYQTKTWYTPATSSIVSSATTETKHVSFNPPACQYMQILTDVTGTVDYELTLNGR